MKSTASKALTVTGMLAAPFYLILIVVLGELEPGFSHLTDPMSLLGGVPGIRGLIFNAGVAFTGVLVIIFGLMLWRQLTATISAKIAFGLLITGGLGLIGAGALHCDEGCKNVLLEPDLVGQLHAMVSFLAGMGTGLAPFFFWAAMRKNDQWKSFAPPTLIAAIFANIPGIIFWSTFLTGYKLESTGGLIQRLGFLITLIWMFYIAINRWRWKT